MLHKTRYFPEPYSHTKNKIKVTLDFSNHTKKPVSKRLTGIDTSEFAKKTDLVSLKSK